MALSGTINGSVTNKSSIFSFYATWSATQSVANNTSTVTVTTYWKTTKTGNTFDTVGTRSASITIAGSTDTITKRFDLNPWPSNPYPIQTYTVTVPHNADGSKTINILARANGGASTWGPSASSSSSDDCTLSASVVLDTIARASQPSCVTWPNHTQNVGEFGDTISIHMNRAPSSNFTHTVRYAYGSLSGTIDTGVTNGTTWEIPKSFMDLIPNSTSGSGTIYVDTYNGSTLIGTKSCGFTATVPASVKPTCSVSVTDGTTIKNTYGSFVKGHSKFAVTVTGTPAYSSPIKSHSSTANGATYTTATFTTGVLKSSGTLTITSRVKDGRGRLSDADTAEISVLDYSNPTIKTLTVKRCDSDGTENDEGDYIIVSFSATVTPLNNKNSATYTLKYKSADATSYTSVDVSSLTGNYAPTYTSSPIAASGDATYDVVVTAADNFESNIRTVNVPTAFALMNWGPDGRSMAIGKVATQTNLLDIALPMRTEQGWTNDQNGVVSKISSPDSSETVYSTTTKHRFNKSVYVDGDIYGNGKIVQYRNDAIKVSDHRDVNSTPQYYISTYGMGAVREFKYCNVIGFTSPAETYCDVLTVIPWNDKSGGFPRQIATIGNQLYVRVGTSETEWGAWRTYLHDQSTIDADTLGGLSVGHYYNYCDNLWSGSLTGSSVISFALDTKYTGYVIIGRPYSTSSHLSIFIPRWVLNTTSTKYQLADNQNWLSFSVYTYNSKLVYLTREGASAESACIVRVMGVS